jgi:YidC/Oxa1 family membrane protein insertase
MGRRLQRIRRWPPNGRVDPPRAARAATAIAMKDKNLILFFVLSALMIGVWFYTTQVLFPPAPLKKDEIAKNEKKKEKEEAQPKKEDEAKKNVEPPAKKEDARPEIKKEEPPVPPAEATIGGEEGYYIAAVLTSRGAGVRRLTLTKFQAANWLGRPVDSPLELIQDDPYEPSFRLYHFPGGNGEVPPVLGLGERHWKLEDTVHHADAHEATLSTTVPGAEHIKLIKTYRLEPRTYHVTLTLRMEDTRPAGEGGAPVTFRYQLTGSHGMPVEGEWYTATVRNAVMALVEGNRVYNRELETADRISLRAGGDRVPAGRRADDVYVQYAGVLNQYFGSLIVPDNVQPSAREGGGSYKDLIAWARPTTESTEIKGVLLEIRDDSLLFQEVGRSVPQTYRLLARVKQHLADTGLESGSRTVLSFYELPDKQRVATWIRPGQSPLRQFEDITVRVNSEAIQLKPGQTVAHRYILYHGPAKTRLLGYRTESEGAVDPDLVARYTDTLHLYTLTDSPTPGLMGKFSQTIHLTDVIILVTRFMHSVLWLLSWIAPSDICIILLTVFVRGLMFPISRRQALFSIKMQELAPEMKKLQEKYKDDAAAKGQAVMELYRKHGVHPLGSCLPLLLQMPIFMGLYFALQESIQFRLAHGTLFFWIVNLAAPDMAVWWGQWIPYISEPDYLGGMFYLGPFLNVLPIVAVVFMVIQQKMLTPPPTDEQQEMQQKMMRWMSLFFGVLFYKVAAGLCIYFISSSLWGLAERRMLPRKKPAAALAAADTPASPAAVPSRRPPRGNRREAKRTREPEGRWEKLKEWWAEVLRQAEKK